MIKLFTYISIFFLVGLFTGCSQVLQTVDLKINAEDNSIQEEFNVIEKTLSIKEARSQNKVPYMRTVLQKGRGDDAHPIPEKIALLSEFPKPGLPKEYKIGIGDSLTFLKLIENNRSPIKKENKWPVRKAVSNYKLGIGDTVALTLMKDDKSLGQMTPINRDSGGTNDNQNLIINSQQNDGPIETSGRIGSDGSVLLLEVGRLEANGKSLNDLRSEVRNILIRNGVSPRFQLEIVKFESQKAYLTISSETSRNSNFGSQVVILTDRKTTLVDILMSANVVIQAGISTRITLQSDNQKFSILLRDLYKNIANNVYVRSGDHIFVESSSETIMTSSSKVDHEGSVIFESVGKVKAAGRSLSELQTEIKNLMQQVPDSQNAFQIQIKEFSSQTALVSIQGETGVSIPITENPIALDEVLTQNGLSIDGNNIKRISLQRNGESYTFTLDDLLKLATPKIYLQSKDRVTTETLEYKDNKVFILGGLLPQIFKINPANRETLADVLFAGGGPLSASSAKRSEVYLLRGHAPVVAYHLDAQSPTRLIVADEMELRPNDILYVAEQPIISFNRTLATIIPLRILLRDIQDENIP